MNDIPAFDRLNEIMETIEYCLSSKRQLPSLILLYTTIDSVSWLTSAKSNEGVRKQFTHWVDNWMLKAKPLGCSSVELYAARCSMLHSLTSDSDLSKAKKVRRILYSLGDQGVARLQRVSEYLVPNEYIAIRIEDLYEAFKLGLSACLEEIQNNPSQRAKFEKKAVQHFMSLKSSDLNDAADILGIE